MGIVHLPDRAIHVWTARTDVLTPAQNWERRLSVEERKRAQAFRFDKHRNRFLVAHCAQRDILSRYVLKEPSAIRFTFNDYGKPFLTDAEGGRVISFNMSHSEDVVLIGVAATRFIGIDVEYVRQVEDVKQIAALCFTPSELVRMETGAGIDEGAFYTCWTRKEAYIKAVGKGLSIPLNSFDTAIPAGEGSRYLQSTESEPAVESWWLTDLVAPHGYKAAVVVEEKAAAISYLAWHEPSAKRTAITRRFCR